MNITIITSKPSVEADKTMGRLNSGRGIPTNYLMNALEYYIKEREEDYWFNEEEREINNRNIIKLTEVLTKKEKVLSKEFKDKITDTSIKYADKVFNNLFIYNCYKVEDKSEYIFNFMHSNFDNIEEHSVEYREGNYNSIKAGSISKNKEYLSFSLDKNRYGLVLDITYVDTSDDIIHKIDVNMKKLYELHEDLAYLIEFNYSY